jgi:hypothetical protein
MNSFILFFFTVEVKQNQTLTHDPHYSTLINKTVDLYLTKICE